jgi:hypothetical protein
MEPDWFAKSTPPRTSGFSCSQAKPPLLTQMHCRNTSGMPAQLPAGRRAWSHFLCAAPVLPPYPWPLTCSCVACCLARAHVYGIEPSRPPQNTSARNRERADSIPLGPPGSATLPPFPPATCCDAIRAGLPPPPVLCCVSNPRRVTPTLGSARARPPRAVAQLLLPLPSALGHLRSSRAARGAA